MNELLIIATLLFAFGGVLIFFHFFGKNGVFAWLAFTTVTANIEVLILVNAFGMEQTLGNTLFAASFLATDILSEIYGKKTANKAVCLGISISAAFIVLTNIWMHYSPSANDWAYESIKTVFSNTPRLMLASLSAYAVSEMFDVWAYHKWWNFTKAKTGSTEKYLWLRNNGSTLLSQFLNIVLFNFAAFTGIYDFSTLAKITVSCYVIYIFTSFLDTPFVYLARKIHKKHNADSDA